jgi:hypothetical protein
MVQLRAQSFDLHTNLGELEGVGFGHGFTHVDVLSMQPKEELSTKPDIRI